MREVEVEIICAEFDFGDLMTKVAGHLGLPLYEAAEGKTTDHYLDTMRHKLRETRASLRLREKYNPGRKNELRLTIKYPLESHDVLLIRDEVRLRLHETDWKSIIDFANHFAVSLGSEALSTRLIVDEYYQQASIGTGAAHLDVSYDSVAYVCPDDPDRHAEEYVLEFEDHGIGEAAVLKAYEFIHQKFGWNADRRGKYRRGMELLGLMS